MGDYLHPFDQSPPGPAGDYTTWVRWGSPYPAKVTPSSPLNMLDALAMAAHLHASRTDL